MRERARRVRVFLADDHPLYVDGVAAAVGRDPALELVGRATNGREALEQIRSLEPDVALVDVRMPEIGGVELAKAVRRDALGTRVVLVSAVIEAEVVYAAVAAGAHGYLVKEVSRAELCQAVAAVARDGNRLLSPAVQQALMTGVMLHTDASPDRPALSAREREVLGLMADGMTTRAIADRLVLSEATIKSHQQNIYEKLDVHDRAAAVAAGMRLGLVE